MFRTSSRCRRDTTLCSTSGCLAWLLFLLLSFQNVDAGNGNGKGKPGGGDDPPINLPPIRYQLTMLDDYVDASLNTRASSVIASGTVVGYVWGDFIGDSSAFLYTSAMGVVELNALAGAVWTDVNADPSADPVTGWIAEVALEINENNQISGRARHSETGETRAFILINTFSSPQFLLLPKVGTGNVSYVFLNDHGDVIATQNGTTILYKNQGTPTSYTAEDLGLPTGSSADINNSGVIVNYAGYRYSPQLGTAYFPDHKFYAVNNGVNGPAMMTGGRAGKNGKNGYDGGAIRMDVDGDATEVLFASRDLSTLGRDVNDSNDVCFHADVDGPTKGFLYTDEYGALPLDELMDEGSQQSWLSEPGSQIAVGISNAAAGTGYGYICGRFQEGSTNRAFLLTPVHFPGE